MKRSTGCSPWTPAARRSCKPFCPSVLQCADDGLCKDKQKTPLDRAGHGLFKACGQKSAALAAAAALIPSGMSISARLRAEQLAVFFDSCSGSNRAIAGLTGAGWGWDRHKQSSSVIPFYDGLCPDSSPKWVLVSIPSPQCSGHSPACQGSGFSASSGFLLIARMHDRSLGGCVLRLDQRVLLQLVSMNGLSASGCRWFCCWRAVCCSCAFSNGRMDQLC
ncbi:hypothetical protein MITS9509_01173 [Synechococcus sp. MIT S9509]|nr:hypothetical protein MITS9509_01173 [Synechococcus sp. MIT S9509]